MGKKARKLVEGVGGDKSIVDHLEEARRRLWVSVIVFFLASVFSYPLAATFLERVREDLLSNVSLIIVSPLEALGVKIQFSLLLGFMISLPVLAYEVWAFFNPGLNEKERKTLAYAILPSIVLFLVGVFFAYKILLPVTLNFMLNEAYPLAYPMLSLSETFSFILFMLLTTGLSFQLPIVVAALSKVGVVDHKTLSSKRRHVIVLIFILAAAITPDPTFVSQLLVAVPMILLYEASVWVTKTISR